MSHDLRGTLDAVLNSAITGIPDIPGVVPGVVAMATDRNGNLYEGTAGVRKLGDPQPMTLDTVFALFSTTKAITATAALQLVEAGQLDLDKPASDYAPALAKVQVLDGFEASGEPRLRAPKSAPTTRQLLTHSAGFAYEFFDTAYEQLGRTRGLPSALTGRRAALDAPLVFDPGAKWEYGINLDWVGQVVEQVAQARLGDVFRERIFQPLGITDMSFEPDASMQARRAAIHDRLPDMSLRVSEFSMPAKPEVHMCGHGLYGTVGEYMKFIRMWLNDGNGPNGRVLKPETVKMALQRHLAKGLEVTAVPGVIKTLSNDAEFFPGIPKSWSIPFMINEEAGPTGRPAGGQGWAGLANLFYWVDPANGVGAFWATQILPFGDPASFVGYLGFEGAIYQSLG